MTFLEIRARVADRLNLTSAEALSRIGEEINERYREIASSIGLPTTIRDVATGTTIIGDRSVQFLCAKIFSVYDSSTSPVRFLKEKTFAQIKEERVGTDHARAYAIQLMGPEFVTIYLDSTPQTVYLLDADVEINLIELQDDDLPAFPSDFHDILTRGAMADELYKMEKYDMSERQEQKFEKRLSDLRLFIAKSAYLDIAQGLTPKWSYRSPNNNY